MYKTLKTENIHPIYQIDETDQTKLIQKMTQTNY